MDDDIQNCCRICLDVERDHISINSDPAIQLHLKSCLAITILPHDGLPKVVCSSCVIQLNDFYNFQLNARCSQDWLESSLQDKVKKSSETKTPIQPLPDSEYNSDSLLEFLNNTANIEEYLNNLGKEDIPSIVNLLDRNENSLLHSTKTKVPTPKKKDGTKQKSCIKMEIDVLDSDMEIVKELLMKGTEPKSKVKICGTDQFVCFACNIKLDSVHNLTQHLSICDVASRTCVHCKVLFDSKQKMQHHFLTHTSSQLLFCNCGREFSKKEDLSQHQKTCVVDFGSALGCSYRCRECGVVFKERFQLYRHAKKHVLKSEERICDICGHSFIGNGALSNHKKQEHEKADNLLYRCKVCNMTSANHKEIYLHVQKHTTKQKEYIRHLCESCGQSFSTHSSLLRHSQQHFKTQRLTCNICFKHFTHAKALDEHRQEHSKMIMCERCGQSVYTNSTDKHQCI